MKPIEILLLSQSDIIQLDLHPDDVLGAVDQAMREHSAGSYEMHPKIGVHPTGTDPDNFIHAMPAYLKQLKSARDNEDERIIAIPVGMAICDIALGHLTLSRAREKAIGQTFRLAIVST